MYILRFSFLFYLILGDYGLHVSAVNSYEFLMPNVRPHKNNIYLCTSIKIRANFHLVGFEPTGSMHGAHQMLLYGCSEPGSDYSVWNCGEKLQPCLSGSVDQIVYAWSRDTPSFRLPKRVGFSVGGNSSIQHLVLQVHYRSRLEKGKLDDTGIFINYTKQAMPLQAGIILLETKYSTVPSKKHIWMENACTLLEDKVIHPFAFRTHAHDLGVMVAGYVVRQGVVGDKWSMLGKRDPRLRQKFSPVADNAPIEPGDVLATRCTMHNPTRHAVRIGKTHKHENCQFYLMYWVENDTPLERKYCFSLGPPSFYWNQAIENFQNIPDIVADFNNGDIEKATNAS